MKLLIILGVLALIGYGIYVTFSKKEEETPVAPEVIPTPEDKIIVITADPIQVKNADVITVDLPTSNSIIADNPEITVVSESSSEALGLNTVASTPTAKKKSPVKKKAAVSPKKVVTTSKTTAKKSSKK